jgi:hypothetical protein
MWHVFCDNDDNIIIQSKTAMANVISHGHYWCIRHKKYLWPSAL